MEMNQSLFDECTKKYKEDRENEEEINSNGTRFMRLLKTNWRIITKRIETPNQIIL